MRRGRVLNVPQAASRAQPESRETVRQVEEKQQEPDVGRAAPTVARGRAGRILTQLAAMSLSERPKPVVEEEIRESSRSARVEIKSVDQPRASSATSGSSGADDVVHVTTSGGSGTGDSGSCSLSRRNSSSSSVSQPFAELTSTTRKVLTKQRSSSGQPVELSLNYMTFNTSSEILVEEYHVEFCPNIESIRLRGAVLRSEVARSHIGNVMHWNGTNLYLPNKLPKREVQFETDHPSVPDKRVRVRLTWLKSPPEEELVQFYNSLMHKVMNRLKYVIINRQHYSPLHKIAIEQHKLELWPGWVTSIQRLDDGLKLSVDASFKVLRLQSVRDIMIEIRQRSQSNLKEAIEMELTGSIVMTRYNNRPYRIDGIEFGITPEHSFIQRDTNREITYANYMKEHWNVDVKDLKQPMIIHKPKPKPGQLEETVYLIPELCSCTGITDKMRSNYTVMKSIADYTRVPPAERENKLTEFLNQMVTDERAVSVFKEWNLSLNPELDIVEGRRIETETITLGQNRTFKAPDNVDWTRPVTSGAVYRSVDIVNWVIMYTEHDSAVAQDFLNMVRDVAKIFQIHFHPPRVVKLQSDSAQAYVNAGKREVRQGDQLVVILTPGKSQREDRYSACKRLFSCEIPVPSQFIRSGVVGMPGKGRSITQKIVIQLLSKCGGAPWAMKMPLKSFMIVGIDVYHDTIDRKKSCVAFVATTNETSSRWWSTTFFQSSLEEIGQSLGNAFLQALARFHKLNGFMPQKVIVYRDGVGDGQLNTVLNIEVNQVLNAISTYLRDSHGDQPKPQLSYLIVQKRINAKMAWRAGGRVSNPLPGTFLDHTITHPEYNDFYLVSQHVAQGTVSPTKYILISESGGLKLEHHQRLAYKMSYMYYNWCGTIRVPAPCQYAHKLAYLTGQNIRQQPSDLLADKLYFL